MYISKCQSGSYRKALRSFAYAFIPLYSPQYFCKPRYLCKHTFNDIQKIYAYIHTYMVSLERWEVWIAFIGLGVVVLTHTNGYIHGVIMDSQRLYLKRLHNRICGLGMPSLVLPVQTMISTYWTFHQYLTAL